MGPLAILTTGTESLEDVIYAARLSLLTIRGEPIAFDLRHIGAGGSTVLREMLLADIMAARNAQWFADHGFALDYTVELAAKNRRIVWLTWRAYRAAQRAEQAS